MSEFVYNKALGFEFNNQFTKLIKNIKLIFNNPNVSLGKEHLKKVEKFILPYEETVTSHFDNATKFYMEVFFNFMKENKSFFSNDISVSSRKDWLTSSDVQVLIKNNDKVSKTLCISTIYRTAIHISNVSKSSGVQDETLLYPEIVLLHLFRIFKIVSPPEWTEEREVLTVDIKSLSIELGLEKAPVANNTTKSPMNIGDIFNPKNMGLIENAIKAITNNDKFNSLLQNFDNKDTTSGNSQLNTADLTTGVMDIMNAMKNEIPGILSSIQPSTSTNPNS